MNKTAGKVIQYNKYLDQLIPRCYWPVENQRLICQKKSINHFVGL